MTAADVTLLLMVMILTVIGAITIAWLAGRVRALEQDAHQHGQPKQPTGMWQTSYGYTRQKETSTYEPKPTERLDPRRRPDA